MKKNILKPYHGILLLVLCLLSMVTISPYLGARFGLYGSLIGECIFLLLSIGVAVVFHGDMHRVFPLKKPKLAPTIGTGLLWLGTFVGVMIITLILSYFFPEQVIGVSQELGAGFTSVPFAVSFVIVAIAPAICEESVFRGVVLNSFRPFHNKWIMIIGTGLIFGAFHGSIWRFLPTALLGMMLGYILVETDNLFYTALMHGINNAVPIVMLYGLQGVYNNPQMQAQMSVMTEQGVPLTSIAIYIIWGAMIPFCLYLGNHLLHQGMPGYAGDVFSKEKRKTVVLLVFLTIAIFVIGLGVFFYSLASNPEFIRQVLEQGVL
ncbi:MAG: type II CAAX endopeptidase family protein [Lachnospiraceae bacterium]